MASIQVVSYPLVFCKTLCMQMVLLIKIICYLRAGFTFDGTPKLATKHHLCEQVLKPSYRLKECLPNVPPPIFVRTKLPL